ncbi:MAG: methyltransferase domain-containing protein, partial [Syntrophales bacterium]|nr:methyltransferase domain-containing protein [Syntrophales bacterium]
AYDHQRTIKERQVREITTRIGKLPSSLVNPLVASPRPFHYRCKVDVHVVHVGGQVIVGFVDGEHREVVPISRCEIVEEGVNVNLAALQAQMATRRPAGGRRYPLWSWEGTATAHGGPAREVTVEVGGLVLTVPYHGFFQANRALVPHLIHHVLEVCAPTGREVAVDAHCGSGLFALFLAPYVGEVWGIDRDGDAIACARRNAHRARRENAAFIEGDAGEVLGRDFLDKNKGIDILILDPPRTGCAGRLLEIIGLLQPPKVVYISCHPATQARDLARLTDQGFRVASLTPFDMFPQTAHVETVAVLKRS